MPPIHETLIDAGLEPVVAEIYLILVENGESTVPQVLQHTTLSRASVYDALADLLSREYVEYRKEGRNAFYRPVHPNKLFGLLEEKKREVALLEGEMGETVRSLIGSYNLAQNKAGVRFFEGEDGMQAILEDSLTSKETILTFADIEAITKHINEVNKAYVKKRDNLGIKKRAIIADTPFARDYLKTYHVDTTDIRFIGGEAHPFKNVMQIYDGKVSYLTLTKEKMVGVIIQDQEVYDMHRSLFEYIWGTLKSY
ncbi:MAG: helix-turn-helix domain-containing protein [Candidatus Magasanikbacteria bacterium]